MEKSTAKIWKFVLEVVVAAISAAITALGTTSDELTKKLLNEGRVWVNSGTMYGPQDGEGFIRVNMACPRTQLMEGLRRIKQVIDKCN